MYGVHVVAGHDVRYHFADIISVLLIGRVKKYLVVKAKEALAVLVIQMVCGKHLFCIGSHPVRIEPRMQLHSPLVRPPDHILQRVPQLRGFLASLACQPLAPGLYLGYVESVGSRTNLENHRIAARLI